jgi:hypothetical protein
MSGRQALCAVLVIFAVVGIARAVAQVDPFQQGAQQAACQDEFNKLRTELERRGNLLKGAKGSAADGCKLLRSFTTVEAQMVKFLTDKKTVCQIPDQIIKQLTESHAKSNKMRDTVCQAAAAPAAPPPSQGLSGALGSSSIGGPPPEAGGGSGVFDTLTGNVLRQ